MTLIESARYMPEKRKHVEENLARCGGEGYINFSEVKRSLDRMDPRSQRSYDMCQDVLSGSQSQ
jgi:hypothetical protein